MPSSVALPASRQTGPVAGEIGHEFRLAFIELPSFAAILEKYLAPNHVCQERSIQDFSNASKRV